jgi:dTMP kinase
VQRVVVPALEQGKIVLCDRFIDSSLAYQGFARELGDADVFEINRWAVGGLLPDVVVLLDLPADEGQRRIRERARQRRAHRSARDRGTGPQPLRLGDWRDQTAPDRLEAEDLDFHERVRRGYRELARRNSRFVVVKADADADAVARQVRSALKPWLPLPAKGKRGPKDLRQELAQPTRGATGP